MNTVAQSFFVPDYVCCCNVDDSVLFLDMRTQKYSSLDRTESQALAPFVAGWPVKTPEVDGRPIAAVTPLIQELVSCGLLTGQRPKTLSLRSPHIERAMAFEFDGRRLEGINIQFMHYVRFVRALVMARLVLRFCSLHTISRWLSRHGQLASLSPEEVHRLTKIFNHLRTLTYTGRDKCLPDSITLTEFFHLNHASARWVVAVDLRPFSAHSWAQHGSTVLNDALEHARQFTPILIV